jgi:acyl carrier protein
LDQLISSLIEIAARHVDGEYAGALEDPDAEFVAVGLCSLELVELMLEVETAMGIEFPPELMNAETFRTPRTLAAAIAGLRAA